MPQALEYRFPIAILSQLFQSLEPSLLQQSNMYLMRPVEQTVVGCSFPEVQWSFAYPTNLVTLHGRIHVTFFEHLILRLEFQSFLQTGSPSSEFHPCGFPWQSIRLLEMNGAWSLDSVMDMSQAKPFDYLHTVLSSRAKSQSLFSSNLDLHNVETNTSHTTPLTPPESPAPTKIRCAKRRRELDFSPQCVILPPPIPIEPNSHDLATNLDRALEKFPREKAEKIPESGIILDKPVRLFIDYIMSGQYKNRDSLKAFEDLLTWEPPNSSGLIAKPFTFDDIFIDDLPLSKIFFEV